MRDPGLIISELKHSRRSDQYARPEIASLFILAILGFSFWFFMVVPFASHRETYWWLAMVRTHNSAQALAWGISSTYRPLAQAATWLSFRILDPAIFPTSVVRQSVLQGLIYALFVAAWWLICRAAAQRRLLGLIAFVAGGVFFSGYVHLFHIYGLFYAPVMLTLGVLLNVHMSHALERREPWFAASAILLAFWHPFSTALFLGYYFGFYIDSFHRRTRAQHVTALLIIFLGVIALGLLVVIFPRTTMPLGTRLDGFLVSYRTNEVNRLASLIASLMAIITVFSMRLSRHLQLATTLALAVLSGIFIAVKLPVLLLWLSVVLVKLVRFRCWSLFFLALTAALLPFGGAIGTPIYALFGIVISVYVTPLWWSSADETLSFLKTQYVMGAVVAAAMVLAMVRAGLNVPIVTRAARPLLSERERTYQLEALLAWLHSSSYCNYDIGFVDNAGSPVESIDNVISRQNRPPAASEDVRLFWNTVLQCRAAEPSMHAPGKAFVTFGRPGPTAVDPIFELNGRYSGKATLWLSNPQN